MKVDDKIKELIGAAKAWRWHEDKWGGKYYTSAPTEQDEKHAARQRLIKAIDELEK